MNTWCQAVEDLLMMENFQNLHFAQCWRKHVDPRVRTVAGWSGPISCSGWCSWLQGCGSNAAVCQRRCSPQRPLTLLQISCSAHLYVSVCSECEGQTDASCSTNSNKLLRLPSLSARIISVRNSDTCRPSIRDQNLMTSGRLESSVPSFHLDLWHYFIMFVLPVLHVCWCFFDFS